MATAAYHLAKAYRFLRRARAPTAGNPPDVAASRPPDAIAAPGPQATNPCRALTRPIPSQRPAHPASTPPHGLKSGRVSAAAIP